MSDPEIRSESGLQSESWSTTTLYDALYEKENGGALNVAQDIIGEIRNEIEEENYDEYDGDYQEYTPRYAVYSNKSRSFIQKFLKKKLVVILVVFVVCTVGIAVGLSLHFTTPLPTTTVPPIETASATGMLFSNKLNVHLSYAIYFSLSDFDCYDY